MQEAKRKSLRLLGAGRAAVALPVWPIGQPPADRLHERFAETFVDRVIV